MKNNALVHGLFSSWQIFDPLFVLLFFASFEAFFFAAAKSFSDTQKRAASNVFLHLRQLPLESHRSSTSFLAHGLGRCLSKKGTVIAIKGGIIPKAQRLTNRGGGLPQQYPLSCHQQPLVHYVLLWRLVKLLLKPSEQIALTDKQPLRDLPNAFHAVKRSIDILQRIRDQGRNRFTLPLGGG